VAGDEMVEEKEMSDERLNVYFSSVGGAKAFIWAICIIGNTLFGRHNSGPMLDFNSSYSFSLSSYG
jgi:hypothetical protein